MKRLKPGPALLEYHGKQSWRKRLLVTKEFGAREKAICLLCTDVGGRGLDFPAVDWVLQMDCPDSVDSYIHRVGRTARYDRSGKGAGIIILQLTE
jgi:ATP-dependent RNA helicase DDX10/DBP4